MSQVDLNKYKEFVEKVTSLQSNETGSLTEQLHKLEADSDVNMALLLTASIGIASEGGEFAEIVKKCIFQGKPLDSETIFHAKRELDIMGIGLIVVVHWVDPNEVLAENVEKLKARYPVETLMFGIVKIVRR